MQKIELTGQDLLALLGHVPPLDAEVSIAPNDDDDEYADHYALEQIHITITWDR